MSPFAILFLVLLVLGIASFVLGWASATVEYRHSIRKAQANNHRLKTNLEDLEHFIHQQWPNEAQAYRAGVMDGYQQGIHHAAELEEDA